MIIFFTTQLLSVHRPGLRSVHPVPAQQNEGVGCDTAARVRRSRGRQQCCRSSPANGGGLGPCAGTPGASGCRTKAAKSPTALGKGHGLLESRAGGVRSWWAALNWGHRHLANDRLLSVEWYTTLKHKGNAYESCTPRRCILARPRQALPSVRIPALCPAAPARPGRGPGGPRLRCGQGRVRVLETARPRAGGCRRTIGRRQCGRWSSAGLCGSLGRASLGRAAPCPRRHVVHSNSC